jgi:two-component sensor histidine kinase
MREIVEPAPMHLSASKRGMLIKKAGWCWCVCEAARMRGILLAACTLFALATGAVSYSVAERDRTQTLRVVEERTASMSRMIMAHADAAADGAMQIINTIAPLAEAWDMQEATTGRSISAHFKEMAQSSNLISSAWIVDAAGTNIVDSWGYPAKPVSAAERPYFKAHLAGADDPAIMGDEMPGSVTGRERFTISRALRNADGSLKAVIVVGIYKGIFDTLYAQAVTWPGARAGLYTIGGDVLARIETPTRATPAFVRSVMARVGQKQSGTEMIEAGDEARIVSWERSPLHRQLFATSSQPVTTALADWRTRSWFTALFALAANLVFWVLAWIAYRWMKVQHEASANELAVREVSHRVKNSLQLLTSLMQVRARKTEDPAYKEAVREVTNQLMALAETYRFVQSARTLGTADAAGTIEGLCHHLAETYGVAINVEAASPVIVNASHSTAIAVIVNELVTNAIKHGGGPVKVTLGTAKDNMWISVASADGRLPEGFAIDEQRGFGLRAVHNMIAALDGTMLARNLPNRGTIFSVDIPSAGLNRP